MHISRITKLFLLTLSVFTVLQAQDNRSVFGLQPNTIGSHKTYISFQGSFPQYMKMKDMTNGKMVDLPDNTILNEAAWQVFAEYGVADNFNTYLSVPFLFIHHYSLNLNQSAKGFGDLEWGGFYRIWKSQSTSSALSAKIAVIFPTGENKNLKPTEYPLGTGAWQIQPELNGIFLIDSYDIVYSVFYRYRGTDNNNTELGDAAGVYALLQKSYQSTFGDFQSETGFAVSKQFKNEMSGRKIVYSDDFRIQFLLGFSYKYSKEIFFRIGIPYTIYQNDGWFSSYAVQLQFDKIFGLND